MIKSLLRAPFVIFLFATSVAAAPLSAQNLATGRSDAKELMILNTAQSGQAPLANRPRLFKTSGIGEYSTPLLQSAPARGKKRTFRALLSSGADPTHAGFDGDTIIHAAARHRDPHWLKLLLENGANPNVRNTRTGAVPLTEALIADRDKQFEMLLKAGADPNLADATGNTALHVAAQINKSRHVYMLLINTANPADPFIRNAQQQTFQRYLFMTNERLLSKRSRAARRVVLDYLLVKGIPIEADAAAVPNKGAASSEITRPSAS